MPKLTIDDLKTMRDQTAGAIALRAGTARAKVTVHMGTCGIAAGAREVMAALLKEIEAAGRHRRPGDHVRLRRPVQPRAHGDGRSALAGPREVREPDAGEDGAGVPAACPRRRGGDGCCAGRRVRDHRLSPRGGDGHGVSITCAGLRRNGMRLVRLLRAGGGDRGRDREARPGWRGPGGAHRLPGVLRRGAGAHRPAGRGLLLRAEEDRRADAGRGAPAEGAARSRS